MKSLSEYNESRFNGLLLLRNDNDYADVVFLYNSFDDVMVDDMHYIKSVDYNGYVKCCGKGCPACARKIRTQTKLPIPLYNITEDEIEIWDRNITFQYQLSKDIFNNYPNPKEVLFRITRHGVSGDINTKYEIKARGMNVSQDEKTPLYNVEQKLFESGNTIEELYEKFCKTCTPEELEEILAGTNGGNNNDFNSFNTDSELRDYRIDVSPRNGTQNNPDTKSDEFMNIPDGTDDTVGF